MGQNWFLWVSAPVFCVVAVVVGVGSALLSGAVGNNQNARFAGTVGGGVSESHGVLPFQPFSLPLPRCPLLLLTGLYDPGCRSQWALQALLGVRAAEFNLLAMPCMPLPTARAVAGIRAWPKQLPQRAALRYYPWLGWLATSFTVVFAVLHNLPARWAHGWLCSNPFTRVTKSRLGTRVSSRDFGVV